MIISIKLNFSFLFFRPGSNPICDKPKREPGVDLVDFKVKKAFINVFYFMENHDVREWKKKNILSKMIHLLLNDTSCKCPVKNIYHS